MTEQHAFAAALLDPEQTCPPGLTTWNGSDPARRFAVYRNNVAISLVDALADTFAVTQELVGETFFRAMARVYAYARPPASRLMAFYGDTFPDFIERFPPAAGLPYLADVARLEFLRVRAYHAADVAPVAVDRFAAALGDEAALPTLRLRLHPSLVVLASRFAVVSLWAAHQGVGELAAVVPDQPETALILRHELDVEVIGLAPADGGFIAALLHGTALGPALQEATRVDTGFNPAQSLGLLIQKNAVVELRATCTNEGESYA
jgi:hypothetical protein